MQAKKIAIIGGCGHVGLPLGVAFADKDFSVSLVDINQAAIDKVNSAELPFLEYDNADVILKKVIANQSLVATKDNQAVKEADVVIFVTGTPVDEHLNPKVHDVLDIIEHYLPQLNSNQLIVLRSTVYPGVTEVVDHQLQEALGDHKLAFCPERVAQGYGISEIFNLPQIVSATTIDAEDEAAELFGTLTDKIKRLQPEEAELAKLMTNSWRYIEFAIANQFYMMTEARGLDFYRIFDAITDDYPRAKYFAKPGLAAGPCLFKDTMQLSAYHESNFFLGHTAMLVNEGLPVFLAKQMEEQLGTLKGKKVAILGMAFKANNDDHRESLSFKLRKLLEVKMAEVLMTDVYDDKMMPLDDAIEKADGVILGVPHREYLNLTIDKPFVDCWGVWRKID